MNILNVQNLSKAYGPDPLFTSIAFAIDEGEKVAIIGKNGCGKSTLFRILAGQEEADEGIIAFQRGASVSFLPQDPVFAEGATPRSVASDAMQAVKEAIAAFETIATELAHLDHATEHDRAEELLSAQATAQRTIDRGGGWAWHYRVEAILDQLGLNAVIDAQVADLSGGNRRRVDLARVLLEQADLLILDEPTNHLDADTVEWLEQTLAAYEGAVVLVTHDRYFLDRVVDRILEIDELGFHSWPGHYALYLERKLERLASLDKANDRRLKLLEKEIDWLSRSPSARTGKAKYRVDQVEELRKEGPSVSTKRMQLQFATDSRLGGLILEAHDVSKSYGDLTVLKDVSLVVNRQDKLGIIGPNGCGKSTMLRIILGQEKPDSGGINFGKNTRVAYLSQTRDGLKDEDTVYESVGPGDYVHIGDNKIHKRSWLSDFLFAPEVQRKRVISLSGGERCRLLLAKLVLTGANLIVLDEPTNDLDIASLQVLEDALAAFEGCVLLVTHDRYFLNRVCNVIVAFEEGKVTRYDGDWDFYRKRRDERDKERKRVEREVRDADRQEREAEQSRQRVADDDPRKLTWKERREFEGIEQAILEAEDRKDELEKALSDPALYARNAQKIPELTAALNAATAAIDALYHRWQELEARAHLS